MRWVTRQYLHLDRVASPWLLLRFVDPEATFSYVPWGEETSAPSDAIPLALPGAELGPHDAKGSTFDKIVHKYGIQDPAVFRLGEVVSAGIAYVLKGFRPGPDDTTGQIAVGLLTFAEGVMLTNQDDDAILNASLPVYDALYANFRVRSLLETSGAKPAGDADGRGPSAMFEQWRGLYNEAPPRWLAKVAA